MKKGTVLEKKGEKINGTIKVYGKLAIISGKILPWTNII